MTTMKKWQLLQTGTPAPLMFPAEITANSGLLGKLSNNLNRNKKNRIDRCGFFAVAVVN